MQNPYARLYRAEKNFADATWNLVVAFANWGYTVGDPAASAGEKFLAGLDVLTRLLAAGSEWGGFASLTPGRGGARAAAREAAEEAGKRLARQGAKQSARNADEWVKLYRAVSPEELEDIMRTGVLRQHPKGFSMEGKWFTTTPEPAATWGKKMYKRSPYSIVEVQVHLSVLRQMYHDRRLEAIGSAYFAESSLLPLIKFVRELPYIPWIP